MATKIQLRRDTAADWTSGNPTLAAGEFAWESDTNRYKIGDGATAWNSLGYADTLSTLGDLSVTGSTISSPSNADLTLTTSGTGDIVLDALRINGTTLDSSDSSSININEGLIVDGTASFSGAVTITSGTITGITDITVADGGTGASTLTDGGVLLGSGTGAITAMSVLSDGEMIVGDGSTDPVAESGATLRTSIGVGTGDSPQFTGLTVTGNATLDGLIIHDNSLKTATSNANLEIGTQGTGKIEITTDDSSIFEATKYEDFFGSTDNIRGVVINSNYEVDVSGSPNRGYQNVTNMDTKLITGSGTASNFRQRTQMLTNTTDMNGFSYTRDSFIRGPLALSFGCVVMNTGGSASTLNTARGFDAQVGIYVYTGSNLASDCTITNAYGGNSTIYCADDGGSASGSGTITNAYNWRATYYKAAGETITNIYAYYNGGAEDSAATNRFAFYSTDAAASSRMGAIRLDNQSGDPTHGADFSWIYAKDDSASSEVYVKDEAGNATKISPHNDAGEWEYYSKNSKTGKTVRVNMEKMIRKLEEFTGESFIETI
tara:strand:- start:1040 stop:2683 length:1644 start_codon:yes stop_codon:yes gene_type:complete